MNQSDPFIAELIARRFRMYDEAAPLLVRAARGDAPAAMRLQAVCDAVRRLEEHPAYLTTGTRTALAEVRAAIDAASSPPAQADAAEESRLESVLLDKALLLHAQLASALQSEDMMEPVEALGLSIGQHDRLLDQEEEVLRVREERDRQLEARMLWRQGTSSLAEGDTRRAVRCLEQSVTLDLQRPTYHNDLGLALAAAGDDRGAVAEYRRALELSRSLPDRRGPGWALTWFNLAKALRRVAEKDDKAHRYKEASDGMREALEALAGFVAEVPEGRRAEEARELAEIMKRELARIEKSIRILEGEPRSNRPVGTSPAGQTAE